MQTFAENFQVMPVASLDDFQQPEQDVKAVTGLLAGFFGRKPKTLAKTLTLSFTPTGPKSVAEVSDEAKFNKELVNQLSASLLKTEMQLDAAELGLKDAHKTRDGLIFINDALDKCISQLKTQITALQKESRSLSQSHEATKLKLEDRIGLLEQELSQTHAELDALRKQLKEQADCVGPFSQFRVGKDQLLAKFRDVTENGRRMLIQLESSREESDASTKAFEERARFLDGENQVLAQQIQDLQNDLNIKSITNIDLEEKLAMTGEEHIAQGVEASRKLHDLFRGHKDRYKRYKDAIREKDGQILDLERRLESVTATESVATEHLEARITQLQDDLAREKLNLEEEWASTSTLQKANQDLLDRLSKMDEGQEVLRQTNTTLERQNIEQYAQNQELDKRITMSEGGQIALRHSNKTLEQKVSDLELVISNFHLGHVNELLDLQNHCDLSSPPLQRTRTYVVLQGYPDQ